MVSIRTNARRMNSHKVWSEYFSNNLVIPVEQPTVGLAVALMCHGFLGTGKALEGSLCDVAAFDKPLFTVNKWYVHVEALAFAV